LFKENFPFFEQPQQNQLLQLDKEESDIDENLLIKIKHIEKKIFPEDDNDVIDITTSDHEIPSANIPVNPAIEKIPQGQYLSLQKFYSIFKERLNQLVSSDNCINISCPFREKEMNQFILPSEDIIVKENNFNIKGSYFNQFKGKYNLDDEIEFSERVKGKADKSEKPRVDPKILTQPKPEKSKVDEPSKKQSINDINDLVSFINNPTADSKLNIKKKRRNKKKKDKDTLSDKDTTQNDLGETMHTTMELSKKKSKLTEEDKELQQFWEMLKENSVHSSFVYKIKLYTNWYK